MTVLYWAGGGVYPWHDPAVIDSRRINCRLSAVWRDDQRFRLGKSRRFYSRHAASVRSATFSTPAFNGQAMMLIAPVAVILVAET